METPGNPALFSLPVNHEHPFSHARRSFLSEWGEAHSKHVDELLEATRKLNHAAAALRDEIQQTEKNIHEFRETYHRGYKNHRVKEPKRR